MVDHAKPAPRALSLRADPIMVAALGFVLAAGPAAWNGGYFAGSWAWIALGTFTLATIRLILVPRVGLGRLDWALLALLAAFAGWLALSGLWSPALTPTLTEVVRALAYLGAVLLTLLLVRRTTVIVLLGSLLAGVTAVSGYALLTRLLPDRIGSWDPATGYRLADPIGYWNGLGIYAAMGTLLAVGLVARSHSRVVRGLAGATPPILVTTMLFTFSRGAWIALGIGLLVAFAVDPRRLQLVTAALALAPWSAALLLVAAQSGSLTTSTATLARVTDDGHQFVLLVAAMAVLSAAAALVFGEACDRVAVPRGVRRGFALVLAALALAGVGFVWSSHGPPWEVADRAWQRFTAPPKQSEPNVTSRLFDLSSTFRVDLWRVSVDQFEANPLKGEGAGSFAAVWFKERPITLYSREGHNLYTETMGELGIVGLALLVALLAVPLAAAVRRRRDPLVAIAPRPLRRVPRPRRRRLGLGARGRDPRRASRRRRARRHARGEPRRDLGHPRRCATAYRSSPARSRCSPSSSSSPTCPCSGRRSQTGRAAGQSRSPKRTPPSASPPGRRRPCRRGAGPQRGLGQLAKARSDFRRALAKSPNDYELWVDYAGVVGGKAAIAALERAVALNPRDPQLRALLTAFRSSAQSS